MATVNCPRPSGMCTVYTVHCTQYSVYTVCLYTVQCSSYSVYTVQLHTLCTLCILCTTDIFQRSLVPQNTLYNSYQGLVRYTLTPKRNSVHYITTKGVFLTVQAVQLLQVYNYITVQWCTLPTQHEVYNNITVQQCKVYICR